jgi:hypothetical protein
MPSGARVCDFTDATCHIEGLVAGSAKSAFADIATQAAQAATDLLAKAMTWWVATPSVSLTGKDAAPIEALQAYTKPLVGLILVLSVLTQAFWMIVSRKKEPLLNIVGGLVRYTVVVTIGLIVESTCLALVDGLCTTWFSKATTDFAQRVVGLATPVILTNPMLLLTLSAVLGLLAAIQWVMAMLRQAGLLVLAVLLPLAAAGSLNDATKPWLRKLIAWAVPLTTYKLMAMLIYAIGFSMLGGGQDLSTIMVGIMVLFLAVFAMPVMMKFFTPFGAETSGGGTAGVLVGGALAAGGAIRLASAMGGAPDSASRMERSGPGTNSGGGPPPGSTPPPSGGPTTGPGGNSGPTGPAGPNPASTPPTAASGGAGGGAGAGAAASGGAGGGAAAGGAAAAGPAGAAAAAGVAVAAKAKQGVQDLGNQFGGTPS